ncbi:MAG: N-acetylneuraminate synthase family protein [bacterium]
MGKERDAFFKSLPQSLTYEPLQTVTIGNRVIGAGHPAYIIAEVGANHRGDINVAFAMIDKAKEAGADAIKFQHLTHDKIAADTIVFDDWHGKEIGSLSGFYKSAEMPYDWTERLIAHAKEKGIDFLSTPFDKEAVDILEAAGVDAFKVASYELTDDILLKYIASKGRPLIISTGMADIEEVAHAIKVAQQAGNDQIILLHCTSIYPPKTEDLNLRAITTLQQTFKLPVGYSDHSEPPYIAVTLTAVALGACVIEKHITNDREEGGSNDDVNSMEISEFQRLMEEIRNVEASLSGSGIKQPVVNPEHKNDEINDRWARRTLYAAQDLQAGDTVTEETVITLRPWGGIEPKYFPLYAGRKLTKPIKAREPLTPDHF